MAITEAHGCEQLAQGCYPAGPRPGIELATIESRVQRSNHYTTEPPRTVHITKLKLNFKTP